MVDLNKDAPLFWKEPLKTWEVCVYPDDGLGEDSQSSRPSTSPSGDHSSKSYVPGASSE